MEEGANGIILEQSALTFGPIGKRSDKDMSPSSSELTVTSPVDMNFTLKMEALPPSERPEFDREIDDMNEKRKFASLINSQKNPPTQFQQMSKVENKVKFPKVIDKQESMEKADKKISSRGNPLKFYWPEKFSPIKLTPTNITLAPSNFKIWKMGKYNVKSTGDDGNGTDDESFASNSSTNMDPRRNKRTSSNELCSEQEYKQQKMASQIESSEDKGSTSLMEKKDSSMNMSAISKNNSTFRFGEFEERQSEINHMKQFYNNHLTRLAHIQRETVVENQLLEALMANSSILNLFFEESEQTPHMNPKQGQSKDQ